VEFALEILHLFAQCRGSLLEVGERRIVLRSHHCFAGGRRIGEGVYFAFCLGDTLVRSAQGCAEVARLREDLVFVTFQRDDVVSQPKRLHLAPLGRHTSLQLPHFFIGLRERLCRRGAVCLREVDAVRFDDRV